MAEVTDLCIISSGSAARDSLIADLEREGYSTAHANTGLDALEVVRSCQPRVVLCEWQLAHRTGINVCRMLRADSRTEDCHIILLTEQYDSRTCVEGLAAGADDLIGKGRPFDELVSRVRVGIRMWHLQANLKRAAITDSLTGLYNRSHFANVIDSEFSRSRRYGHRLSIILADLDNFKAINDTYGHQVGDMVLRQVAQILRHSVREVDTVVRYGGEEFVIIVPESSLSQAAELAERLREAVDKQPGPEELHGHRITASLGVASDEDSRVTTTAELLSLCDQAMYAAKQAGRNAVVTSDELSGSVETSICDPGEVEDLRRQVVSLSVQAKEAYVQSIWALVQALEARDEFTARHSQNVTFFAEQTVRQMGLSPALTRSVRLAAMLHDIGKIGVPDSVLLKPGPLTESERAILRKVPQLSTNIVDHMRILQAELPMIRHQREYYDGTGYPLGLKGEQIPIGSRVLMVADAFDALTSDRIFRPSRSVEDALAEMRAHAGTQFDPKVVEALEAGITQDPQAWLDCIESSRRTLKARSHSADSRILSD